MITNEIIETEDRWILRPLRKSSLMRVGWDKVVSFDLADPSGQILVGQNAFLLKGAVFVDAPWLTLQQLGPDVVRQLVGSQPLSLVGFKDGSMRITFRSAAESDGPWWLIVNSEEELFVPAIVKLGDSVIWERPGSLAQLEDQGKGGDA